tara:strand:- start:439 stop:798 length:360 start_codon:yes stop_codon:yes gene_type:complete
MDGVISCDKFKYQWHNVYLLKGGDYDTVDDNISNAADGEFEDDDDYVVDSSNNDSDGDDVEEEEEEEEEDIKDNNRSIDYDTITDDIDPAADDDAAWFKKALLILDWTNILNLLLVLMK